MGKGTINSNTEANNNRRKRQNQIQQKGVDNQAAKLASDMVRTQDTAQDRKKQREDATRLVIEDYYTRCENHEQRLQELRKKNQEELYKKEQKEQKDLAKQNLIDDANLRAKQTKSLKEQIQDNHKATKENLKQQKEALKQMRENGVDKNSDEYKKQKEEVSAARMDNFKAAMADVGEQIGEKVSESLSALTAKMDNYIANYEKYYSSINARVQGAYEGMDYSSLSSTIQGIVGYSPYVQYTDVLENLNSLVEAGTTVNLATRSFLATVSDKIATTFDATNSTLLRIIRLQQTDTTASRLGMEASLTRLFNYYFSDTSYLADAFDSVTQALVGLTSSLDAQSGVEYEYVVQKWLGALGSEGADTSTLTSLANAINALSIGDIDALSSNQGMQNLLIMAANREGLDFSSMLINTPTTQELNLLLYGVIDYIQEIMAGANNVVKNQYASLFGITYTDIKAFENLNQEMMDELYGSVMTYNDTLEELDYQLNEVAKSRTSLGEMVDTVIDNIYAEAASSLFNNKGAYSTYVIADLVESVTGGIQIPSIFAVGSGVFMGNSVEELMKIGVTGYSLMSSLIGGIGSFSDGGALNLSNWNVNYEKGTYTGYTSANLLTTSESNVGTINNTSSSGIQQSMYDEQKASAEEISGTSMDTENEMLTEIQSIHSILSDVKDATTDAIRVRHISNSSEGTSLSMGNTTESMEETTNMDLIVMLRDALNVIIGSGREDGSLSTYNTNSNQNTVDIYDLLKNRLPESIL